MDCYLVDARLPRDEADSGDQGGIDRGVVEIDDDVGLGVQTKLGRRNLESSQGGICWTQANRMKHDRAARNQWRIGSDEIAVVAGGDQRAIVVRE